MKSLYKVSRTKIRRIEDGFWTRAFSIYYTRGMLIELGGDMEGNIALTNVKAWAKSDVEGLKQYGKAMLNGAKSVLNLRIRDGYLECNIRARVVG